jgi:NAD(P)-dependent dehydrogenase (short-subunit alcohol dehydrogenase family)
LNRINKNDLFSLSDQVIIVTGGYGYIGQRVVLDLLNCGAKVQCIGRSMNKLKSLKKTIGVEFHHNLTLWDVELNQEESVRKLFNKIEEKFNKVDGLFNNAASINTRGIKFDISHDEWVDGFKDILSSTYLCTKFAIPIMQKQKSGSIINNASLFGTLSPIPRMYLDLKNEPPIFLPPAKAGVIQFTKYMSTILAKDNIRVNAVSPGWFPKKRGPERLDYMEEIESRIPMNRIGRPEEISGSIIYLMSNASSYITGHNLVIDGGYSAW